MSVAWMICNPSGSRGLHDPSSSGHRESRRVEEGPTKISMSHLSWAEICPIVAAGLHINVRLTQ